jgi:hypothetical protein
MQMANAENVEGHDDEGWVFTYVIVTVLKYSYNIYFITEL